MKKAFIVVAALVAIVIVLAALSGCVSAKYNPETKEFSYIRIGDQKLSGVIVKSGDTEVLIETQESQAAALQRAIETGIELGKAAK